MRRPPDAVRVRAAAVALLAASTAFALAGCSGSPADTAGPARPASTPTSPAPLPEPTSTLRTPTATDPLRYVALGDSYSSGMGGGGEHGVCRRSPNAFPKQLAKSPTIELVDFAACAGATTMDVRQNQLDALNDSIDLITLTIGGNDLSVSALPSACADGETPTCKAAVATSVALLKTLPAKLTKTYAKIAQAAPNARILVADYPLFYDLPTVDAEDLSGRGRGAAALSAAVTVDTAVASLDATIEDAVQKQREAGTDIHFVDVSFNGHGVNAKKPWFVLGGVDAFHPTAAGYKRYAKVLGTFAQ